MAKYTQLNQPQISHLAQLYGLNVDSFQSMEGGAANSSYLLIADQGKCVLTVYEDKSMSQVLEMGKTLLELSNHDFPAVVILQMTCGDLVAEHDRKPVLVKEYIQGQVIKEMGTDLLVQVGRALAHLHQIPAPEYLNREHPYGLERFSTFLGLDFDAKYDAWLSERMVYLKENTPAELPRALIHGDLFYDNVLFDVQNLKAIIDFEEACNYFKVFDLGMALLGICATDGELDLEKAHVLVAGYLDFGSLDESEKNSIQLMTETAAVATSCWRYWKYNLHDPTPERAHTHWELVHMADHLRAIPPNKFTTALFGS